MNHHSMVSFYSAAFSRKKCILDFELEVVSQMDLHLLCKHQAAHGATVSNILSHRLKMIRWSHCDATIGVSVNTKLNNRQRHILSLLTKNYDSLGRSDIAEVLSESHEVSRATVIRDLQALIDQGMVEVIGSGPATRYRATSITRILRPIDADAYFAIPQDDRYLIGTDNKTFFDELAKTPLLTESEIKLIDRLNDDYLMRVKARDGALYRRELQRFTVELAWKSSQIEGNTYSLLETEELLRTQQRASGRSELETQMVLNHKSALDRIMSTPDAYSPLDIADILDIHEILTRDLDITAGIRTQPVGIIGTNYLPSSDVSTLTAELERAVAITNTKEHPVEAALVISGLIAYLQPFVDGNKRTARLVANAILLSSDYAALSYRSVDEVAYKKSVLLIDEQQSFLSYKEMFVDQFAFATKNYFL